MVGKDPFSSQSKKEQERCPNIKLAIVTLSFTFLLASVQLLSKLSCYGTITHKISIGIKTTSDIIRARYLNQPGSVKHFTKNGKIGGLQYFNSFQGGRGKTSGPAYAEVDHHRQRSDRGDSTPPTPRGNLQQVLFGR